MSSPGTLDTRSLEAAPREVRYSKFRLSVVSGRDAGLCALSTRAELSVGTAAGNDLMLGDPSVSRHHCTFVACPGGVQLRDLRSTNGTWSGSMRVESALLPRSATIRIGMTTLRCEVLDEEVHEPLSPDQRFGSVLGRSAAMRRLFALLPKLAESDATILLEGETGTGKGLLAESIHRASGRAAGPFVVVDCSTIPPALVESELFGHEKGAFTGATSSRIGAFEAARGGTVFLDEVGELPLEMQPKLLRALEERVIKRVGTVAQTRLDVRVIAATNRDLRQEVNRGAFRADAYFRLNTVCLRIPPLRERREDIADLVAHFHAQFAGDGGGPPASMIAAFLRRDWPGNVRELRSAVERAVLFGEGELADPADATAPIPPGVTTPRAEAWSWDEDAFVGDKPFRVLKENVITSWERWYLQELMRRHGTNLSRAARAARTDRNYLREMLRRHDLLASDD